MRASLDGLSLGMDEGSIAKIESGVDVVAQTTLDGLTKIQFEPLAACAERVVYFHEQEGLVYIKGFIVGIPGVGLISCGFTDQWIESELGPPRQSTSCQGKRFSLYELGEESIRFESQDDRICAIELFLSGNRHSKLAVEPFSIETSERAPAGLNRNIVAIVPDTGSSFAEPQ